MRPTIFAVLLAILTPACFLSRSTINTPLPTQNVARLEPGVTTAGQTLELLGAPVEVVQLGRRSAYRFDFTQSKRAGVILLIVGVLNEDVRSDRIWTFFDENDVLTHVGATFDAAGARYAAPWTRLHRE